MVKLPIVVFVAVFALSVTLTQVLTYQRYKISKEAKRAELVHEATEAKDRFRSILFNDIAAANTLAIIYKQYGVPANFDSVARQIIQTSRYADALQITEHGIVKNIYPDTRYKATIGTNVNADSLRQREEERAIERKDIYFAGPRRLRFGDTGILGKVPIIRRNRVVAVTTVLTRLPVIRKMFAAQGADKNKFVYQLLKTQGKNVSFFSLSNSKPAAKSEYVDINIPEGDWLLRVSYGNGYIISEFPFELSGLGLLFSFIIALLAYRKVQEPYKLEKIIEEKTAQLAKSEIYFRTLIETSSDAIVLLDPNAQVLYQSPSTERILGYTLAEVQQIDGLQLIHPDDREEDNSVFYKEISEPGAIAQRSHRVKHKNGNYIHIEGTYRNLLHDENIKAIVYSYKDVTEKVRSEQILLESENRFRGAFEDSAIGMGLVSIHEDSMGRWLKVNPSLCDMLGYTEDELLSRTFMQITHPDDLADDLAGLQRMLQGELDTYRLEKRYVHKDGSLVWINLNVSIVKDKDKKPVYLVAQVENITEKLESQTKFQNLVENFVVGVYILQDNKIVYVNPRVAEETGYTEDEIINMPFDSFIHPEDLKLVNDNIDIKANVGITSTRYDARIQGKDGKPIWYEILGSSTSYHGGTALIGTMVNITERKAIYDELIKSEANLKSIFDTTDTSYLLLDTNYDIIAFNQQMKNAYSDVAGFDLKEGHNLFESMLPEKRETARAIYDRTIETNRSENYETTYKKDDTYRHFLVNVKPIHDGTKVIGICASIMDITERKQMTLDLMSHVNAIELQNKKLREIAWIQSHVVRAPLSRLMGLIDLFTNHETDDADKLTILDYILISANELDEVIKSISDKVHDTEQDPVPADSPNGDPAQSDR
jgi:PAS domain S-box-containing protein